MRMHTADYAVARCPSVRLSVTRRYCLYTIIHILIFFIIVFQHQTQWKYSDGAPLTGASNASGYEKNHDFRPMSRFISQMMQDRAIVTMEGE